MFKLKKALPILTLVASVGLGATAYASSSSLNISYLNATANGSLNTTWNIFSNDEATARTDWVGTN